MLETGHDAWSSLLQPTEHSVHQIHSVLEPSSLSPGNSTSNTYCILILREAWAEMKENNFCSCVCIVTAKQSPENWDRRCLSRQVHLHGAILTRWSLFNFLVPTTFFSTVNAVLTSCYVTDFFVLMIWYLQKKKKENMKIKENMCQELVCSLV